MFKTKRICVIISLLVFVASGICLGNIDEAKLAGASDGEQVKDESSKDALSWDGFETDLDDVKEPTRSNLIKKSIMALVFVALLGYGTLYFTKKIAPKLTSSKGKGILITDSLSLGQNKTLHIVEIENKKLLIGCTATSINTLSDLSGGFQEVLQTYQETENEV